MKTLARDRDKDDVLGRLRRIRPDSRRRWGRMSAHQMVCHVADSFRMALGAKPVNSGTGRLQRTLLRWVVLYVPMHWPAGILTSPELDQEGGGTRPAEFEADLAQVVRLLEELAVRPPSLEGRAHPIFGPMSGEDWLRWAYLHTDHHLRQFGA